MSFLKLPNFVTKEEKKHLLSLVDSDIFINHTNTQTGTSSSLHFGPTEFRHMPRACVMKMYPNMVQDWHTDSARFNRQTVILHPLTDDYAPVHTTGGAINTTVMIDTQSPHAVFNNNNLRVNLQLALAVDWDELMLDRNSHWWKLIRSLYE